MLLSKQQTYMLETIQKLGCVRKDQLIALFRLEFCAEDPEAAERVGGSALHRLCSCRQVWESADVYHMDNTKPNEQVLEAIDVMIELAKAKPLDFHGEKAPALLRFSVQEQRVRRFIVAEHGVDPAELQLGAHERVILLFDGRGQAQPLSVSNKQFFAVRQENGMHRYFAASGQ